MRYSKIAWDKDGFYDIQNFTVSKEGGLVQREPFTDAVIVQLQKVMTDEGEKIVPFVSIMMLNDEMEPHLKEWASEILKAIR